MHIGLSLTPFGHHPAAWRRSGAARGALEFSHLAAQVKKAEEGGLDFVLLADRLGQRPENDLSPLTVPFEPTTLVAALATATGKIGFIATAATHQHEPYNLARRFASLDSISKGRTGWNVVGSEKLERDQEYLDVVSGLWDSWADDAFVYDKALGRFFEPDKMHVLNHKGTHFTVRGPLNVNRSPQGRPVISHVLTASTFEIAARFADVVFLPSSSSEEVKTFSARLNSSLSAFGRRRKDVRVLANIIPMVGNSSSDELNAIPDALEIVGTPAGIAERMQALAETADLDGFVILPPVSPEGVTGFVDLVIPELRQRGLFRNAYEEMTLRGHLGLAHPDRLERAS